MVLCQKKDALQNENGFDSNIKIGGLMKMPQLIQQVLEYSCT
jgi:hypothetical protein